MVASKVFLQDLKNFLYDQLLEYKKELNFKKFRLPKLPTTFTIKLFLTTAFIILILKNEIESIKTIFVIFLLIFILFFDEWKRPDWRRRARERLYKKIGVDRKEIRKKINQNL